MCCVHRLTGRNPFSLGHREEAIAHTHELRYAELRAVRVATASRGAHTQGSLLFTWACFLGAFAPSLVFAPTNRTGSAHAERHLCLDSTVGSEKSGRHAKTLIHRVACVVLGRARLCVVCVCAKR